jgi:pilus assembly protein CpaC
MEQLRQEHAHQYRLAGAGQQFAGHHPRRTFSAARPQRSWVAGGRAEHPSIAASDLADCRRRRPFRCGALRVPSRALNRGNFSVDVALNALEQKGLIRSLAEPNLVALSGDTASFLAGGEFPIPVPGSLGTVTIDYKKYGVGLAFTPTVLRQGLINLKIEPEVSELDRSNPVVIAGISVPPLIVRRASTTIELRDGQSFVIGSLLQNRSTTHQLQLPWLGDVPVLGALFSSKRYQKDETDLAIIVTPRLVRPTRPGDLVKTPLDNTLPANDIDFFLMGKAEVTPADVWLAVGHQRRFVGHILDLRKEGANVVQVKN